MDGKYIYCIMNGNHKKNFEAHGIGSNGDPIDTISYEDISAVVSNCSVKEFTVSRENTMMHEKVIEEVMKEYPVLPVRFSTVADSEKDIIEKVLASRYDEFRQLISWIRDKEEIGVKAKWTDMDSIFKAILEENGKIKELKEKIAMRGSPEKTYYERIDLGKLVEAMLKQKREYEKEKILEILKKEAEDSRVNQIYGEDMILNSAFLVKKEKEKDFFSKVSKIQDEYGKEVQLKYVTGSPPFNFVNLVIKL